MGAIEKRRVEDVVEERTQPSNTANPQPKQPKRRLNPAMGGPSKGRSESREVQENTQSAKHR